MEIFGWDVATYKVLPPKVGQEKDAIFRLGHTRVIRVVLEEEVGESLGFAVEEDVLACNLEVTHTSAVLVEVLEEHVGHVILNSRGPLARHRDAGSDNPKAVFLASLDSLLPEEMKKVSDGRREFSSKGCMARVRGAYPT